MEQNCRLLIVDDDEIIREGLLRNIPWQEQGFEVIGSARNGLEGLNLAKNEGPQIIISDIRMPFMDGLQMVEAIKEIDPDVKVIFLTGYDEFNYAKKALGLKAMDYILKSADNDEILAAVIKARTEWQREYQLRGMAGQSQTYLQQKLLQELLLGEKTSEDLPARAESLGLHLAGNQFVVSVIRLDTNENQPIIMDQDSFVRVCREILDPQLVPYELISLKGNWVIIFSNVPTEQLQYHCLEEILSHLFQRLSCQWQRKLMLGVGEIQQGFSHIALSYQEALTAAELQNPLDNGYIAYFHQIPESENHHRLRKILEYVNHHFGDVELTLASVAKEVNICPTYMSTIFKKYQKINFSDYLTGIRMEKAKELLVKTNFMTYQVAEKTGYPNPQYFSVLFKKHTGYTPTEFKNLKGPEPMSDNP